MHCLTATFPATHEYEDIQDLEVTRNTNPSSPADMAAECTITQCPAYVASGQATTSEAPLHPNRHPLIIYGQEYENQELLTTRTTNPSSNSLSDVATDCMLTNCPAYYARNTESSHPSPVIFRAPEYEDIQELATSFQQCP